MAARSRRGRKSRLARRLSAPPVPSEPADIKSTKLRRRASILRTVIGWNEDVPVPIPLIAACSCVGAVILATRFPVYATCPQVTQGTPRLVASIIVGLPIGFGIVAILMIASTLDITASRKNSAGAIRTGLERAGLGAAYGTFMSVFATLAVPDSTTCGTDLLANISNGATWGSMIGLTLSVATLRKGMLSDADSARGAWVKWQFISSANLSLVLGVTTSIMLISSLWEGRGWPQ